MEKDHQTRAALARNQPVLPEQIIEKFLKSTSVYIVQCTLYIEHSSQYMCTVCNALCTLCMCLEFWICPQQGHNDVDVENFHLCVHVPGLVLGIDVQTTVASSQ